MMVMVVMVLAAVLLMRDGRFQPTQRDDPTEQEAAEPTEHGAT
jgi:hypothetical protein